MKTIKTNPLVEKTERGAKVGLQLKGYKATTNEKGMFRLASDLTCKHCYQFSERGILHWDYINEEEGHIRIYLKEDTEIEETISRAFYAKSPFSDKFHVSLLGRNDYEFNLANLGLFQPVHIPFLFPVRNPACEAQCIQEVIKGNGNTTIIPGAGPNSAQIILTNAGRDALRNCLINNCGYWGFILNAAFNDAVAQIQGSVTVSNDPDLPDIPPFPFRR